MALNRKATEVADALGVKYGPQAVNALKALYSDLGGWRKVAARLGTFDNAYVWQVAHGQKHPSRRLLRALGIVKPEKSYGVRIRLSMAEAKDAAHGRLSVGLQLRIARAWINAGGDEGK